MNLFTHPEIDNAIKFAKADNFAEVSRILEEHDRKINLRTHEYRTRKDFEMLVGTVTQLMGHLRGSEEALQRNESRPPHLRSSLLVILRECIDNVERYRTALNCAAQLHQEYYRFDQSTR